MSKKHRDNSDPLRRTVPGWEELVEDMDIPMTRKIGLLENVRWFLRNGGINNRDHPNYEAAMRLAKADGGSGSDDDRYAQRWASGDKV